MYYKLGKILPRLPLEFKINFKLAKILKDGLLFFHDNLISFVFLPKMLLVHLHQKLPERGSFLSCLCNEKDIGKLYIFVYPYNVDGNFPDCIN